MSFAAGARVGPYEIVAPLGAGGMGEVYRARDTRLGRDVAIKALPATFSASADALARFEREARALASLSHPNIITLHDVGQSDGVNYVVMELLDGETLRSRLTAGAVPQRKAIEIAADIARGLAAAHDRGIAHRDLKPENVFLTRDGQVKVLDFGLARQSLEPDAATLAPGTEPGVVLGTVGYMAPEQVKGESSDYRADIFAFGCVLYELLTGRRAYRRDSAPETMTAILKEDPPDPSDSGMALAPAVQRIVRRCLEKRPEQRFQSTRDLVFALESSLDHSSSTLTAGPSQAVSWKWRTIAMVAAGLAVGAAAGALIATQLQPRRGAAELPAFRQITFERGTVRDARFTPDGQSILYAAAWEGNPLRVFMTRTDSPESVRLSLPDARLLSISRSGELAISLGHAYEGWIGEGTLARSSLLGSAPRVVAERVREAEWAPDGSALAIVRRVGAVEQLEFPIGNALYRSSGFISSIRFSPDGQHIAFGDHPVFADDAGGVSIVDRAGVRKTLSDGYHSIRGVAWAPDGNEVWFAAGPGGERGDMVFRATLAGVVRKVWTSPSTVKLLDIAPDGRVLLGHETADRRVEALLANSSAPVDVSLRSQSASNWIANDGSMLTIVDQAAPQYMAHLVKAGGAPVALGDGQDYGVSADGRWVVALPVTGSPVILHPTGAGESRRLPNPDSLVLDSAAWLPDSKRIIMFGQPQGQPPRGYVQDISAGPPRPFTAPGVSGLHWGRLPVSPDGARVIGRDAEGVIKIYSIDGGGAVAVPGLTDKDVPVQWRDDGRGLIVAHGNGMPWIVETLDLTTGRRTPIREIRAHDAAGLRISVIAVSRDGRYYVHSYSRLLTDLFVVTGLGGS
jgi:dipeptidyl aminopeptidase/acylaminoacyl peptidase